MKTPACLLGSLLLITALPNVRADKPAMVVPQVRSHQGELLLTNAVFFSVSGTNIVFKQDTRFEAYPVRALDPALLAQLGLDADTIEQQQLEAERKRRAATQQYAAYVAAVRQRQTIQRNEEMRLAAEQAKSQWENDAARREEWRRDLTTWAAYEQARASRLAADAELMRTLSWPYTTYTTSWVYTPGWYGPDDPSCPDHRNHGGRQDSGHWRDVQDTIFPRPPRPTQPPGPELSPQPAPLPQRLPPGIKPFTPIFPTAPAPARARESGSARERRWPNIP